MIFNIVLSSCSRCGNVARNMGTDNEPGLGSNSALYRSQGTGSNDDINGWVRGNQSGDIYQRDININRTDRGDDMYTPNPIPAPQAASPATPGSGNGVNTSPYNNNTGIQSNSGASNNNRGL